MCNFKDRLLHLCLANALGRLSTGIPNTFRGGEECRRLHLFWNTSRPLLCWLEHICKHMYHCQSCSLLVQWMKLCAQQPSGTAACLKSHVLQPAYPVSGNTIHDTQPRVQCSHSHQTLRHALQLRFCMPCLQTLPMAVRRARLTSLQNHIHCFKSMLADLQECEAYLVMSTIRWSFFVLSVTCLLTWTYTTSAMTIVDVVLPSLHSKWHDSHPEAPATTKLA